ncbi:GNAT superfamily N-acetyltransferase [Nocardioides cavernae]|uniref:GNAT superfamily N-acetyltransferase n=1 Tax=Nocardioides cavernae TaxID=1921566 RepID=A0A7Y9KNS4_9ACTN|nr:GNAT family N-acetyltransferase [Nocardioides cavernae]NYE36011.1 GNAT superfamily N-acetyltransferase [Nocardioides cavernae]
MELHLPAGLTHRPLTLADAPVVLGLIAAEEVHDLGESSMTLEDVEADWARPSYDIASSTVGVLEGDRLIAYADLSTPTVAYTAVLPEEQGRGIGTALAAWLQARARSAGADRVGTQVPQDSAADRLMRDLGYELVWTAWDLELPPETEIAARPLPAGFALADAGPDDFADAWTLLEDAFLEWADRDRQSFDDFGARVWERPGYEPWNLRLVRDARGELVGATHVHLSGSGDGSVSAYVAKVAVRLDHRGRGLAPAMLVDAFGAARAHGATRSYLSTDTRAGARGLYERVGMVVTSTWVNRSKRL